jgi:DNA polymerase III epsilon subunit-like protein
MQQYGKSLDKVKRGPQEVHVMSCGIYVDLETTGTDPEKHEIIEIGAVVFRGGVEIADFAELVFPGEGALVSADPRAMDTNKIAFSDVRRARPTVVVAAAFRKFLEAYEGLLYAFPRSFEESFLKRAPWHLTAWGDCVMQAVREVMAAENALPMMPGNQPKRPSLGEAAAFYGVTGCGPAHRSLSDARKTARIHQEHLVRQAVKMGGKAS